MFWINPSSKLTVSEFSPINITKSRLSSRFGRGIQTCRCDFPERLAIFTALCNTQRLFHTGYVTPCTVVAPSIEMSVFHERCSTPPNVSLSITAFTVNTSASPLHFQLREPVSIAIIADWIFCQVRSRQAGIVFSNAGVAKLAVNSPATVVNIRSLCFLPQQDIAGNALTKPRFDTAQRDWLNDPFANTQLVGIIQCSRRTRRRIQYLLIFEIVLLIYSYILTN